MTQQTHPSETDGQREEHSPASTTEQGGSPEPLWYDGPAAWHSPSAGADPGSGDDHARTGGPDGRTEGPGAADTTYLPAGDFGLSSSGAAQPTTDPAHGTGTTATGSGAPTAPVRTTEPGFGWPTSEPAPAPRAPQGSGAGAFGSFGAAAPDSTSTGWNGDNGWGGPHHPGSAPLPTAPAPEPRTRQGRRWAEIGAVALITAALASGGGYVAAKNGLGTTGTTSSSAGSAPASSSNPPAPVAQGNPSSPDWTATAKAVSPSVVSIAVQSSSAQGQGSGVIIDAAGGYVLTNNHVATGAGTGAKIQVTLSDGRSYDATIKGTDPSTDLAVLQITKPPTGLKAISIGDSKSLVVGQPVMAVGNPLGLAGTVTTGIVSALNRPVTTQAADSGGGQDPFGGQQQAAGAPVVTNAIQTSAAINPGNSGGALVTADGQLIGINSSIASLGGSSGGSQSGNIGIGFAIPSQEAKSIADQLIATGKAEHAYLGVSAGDTTVTDGSSKRAAALISNDVTPGTPAAGAGIKKGDAIIAIDGESIESSESLVATIHEYGVGDKVTVTLIRGGAKQDVQVTLAVRPSQN